MRSTPHRCTWAAWWMLGAVLAIGCAQGATLDPGVGGAGGGSVTTSSTTSSSSSGVTSSSSSGSSSSSSSGSSSSSSTTSSSTSSSSSSGTVCTGQQHLCNGSCVGNTIDSGCFLSSACAPCPMPAHGTALCTSNGFCDLKCDTGYQANAAKTDCEAIPPPPECCDDSACVFPTFCLDGYCRNPFASACEAMRCNAFCKCKTGGTPESVGTCNLDVFVWECLCTP